MPKGLVFGALGLLVLVVLALSWLSNRSMQADQPVAEASDVAPPAATTPAPAAVPPPVAAAPVVITATEPVWIEIKDGGTVLKQGVLAAGERFEVPATAAAPVLTTGKPEALAHFGRNRPGAAGRPGRQEGIRRQPEGCRPYAPSGCPTHNRDDVRGPRGATGASTHSAPVDTAGSTSRNQLCGARSTGRNQ